MAARAPIAAANVSSPYTKGQPREEKATDGGTMHSRPHRVLDTFLANHHCHTRMCGEKHAGDHTSANIDDSVADNSVAL